VPDPKAGEPFGLDPNLVNKIDWHLALSRIASDLKSDFIYAPHLAYSRRLVDARKSSSVLRAPL
jgi:hypothetical protein